MRPSYREGVRGKLPFFFRRRYAFFVPSGGGEKGLRIGETRVVAREGEIRSYPCLCARGLSGVFREGVRVNIGDGDWSFMF